MKRAAAIVSALAALGALASAGSALAGGFTYDPPGVLVAGSGTGRKDDKVYAPGILFPIQDTAAFANSQVWGAGGGSGPGGSQCDKVNFTYPWHDNYCETRSWSMPLCPSGAGHQGQDTRASDCTPDVHPGVAVDDGTITHVGSYTVYLTVADGTRYDYLHMSGVTVAVGDKVKRGQMLGHVSNQFGGSSTTVHLHFNIQQNVAGTGVVFVPPYLSLIQAYETMLGVTPGDDAGVDGSVPPDAGHDAAKGDVGGGDGKPASDGAARDSASGAGADAAGDADDGGDALATAADAKGGCGCRTGRPARDDGRWSASGVALLIAIGARRRRGAATPGA